MESNLFETALGIHDPWHVTGVNLDAEARILTIRIDFKPGSRFTVAGEAGTHLVHDTVEKRGPGCMRLSTGTTEYTGTVPSNL